MKPDQIKKYIELVYSQESELNKIENLADKKKTAMEKVGIDPKSDVAQSIMLLKNKDVTPKILAYMEANNSNKCALLNSRRQLFWELQERLMKPLTSSYKNGETEIEVDDEALLKAVNLKTTISDKAEELIKGIERLQSEIYIGKEETEAADMKRLGRLEDRIKNKST